MLDEDYPAGVLRYYWKSLYLSNLSDDAIDLLLINARRRPSSLSTVDIWHMGGAVSRITADESAWAHTSTAALLPFSDGSEYLNFPGMLEQGEEPLRRTFGINYERLIELKNTHNPTNLFRLNANIRPTQT